MGISAEEKLSEGGGASGEGRHSFTVTINNQAFETEAHQLTGVEIKTLGGFPPDYELFIVKEGKSTPVANDEQVHIHEHIEFRAIPAGTFGFGGNAPASSR
jgi:hypothetical protein